MQTELSNEQRLLRDVVSRFFRDQVPTSVVRETMASPTGYDPVLWQEICGEVGLAGVHIPEAYGGGGFGPIELGIVAEEMGRTLYCGPFFASAVMAGYGVLLGASEPYKQALLPQVVSGSKLATLVLDDVSSPDLVGASLSASEDGKLTGTASLVLDAHIADILLVLADSGQGSTRELGLYSILADASGMCTQSLETLDPTRRLSRVTFDQAAAEKIGDVDQATLELLWDSLCVALAHEMIGGAQALLESTVEYTKERVQFGRPIGSFQALKHRCADLLLEVELARAVTHHAARCLAAKEGEPHAASMAKAMASDAYMSAARAGIQLRGGIGFTWENDTHLWFKRAKSSEVFLGSPHAHRERMMNLLEAAS